MRMKGAAMREVFTFVFLGINAWTDWRKKQISLAAAGIYGGFGLIWSFWQGKWGWGMLLSVSVGFCFLLLSLLTDQAVGIGDGLLLTALGTVLEVEEMLFTVCIGLFAAAVWSLLLLTVWKKGRKAEIPFIPFLWIGYVGGCYIWRL